MDAESRTGPDPGEQGLIQGPLDLEFLRGRKISVVLEPGQMAMLIQDSELKAVYLDGAHYLDIGHGSHQVPAESSLIFLAANRHINLMIGGCSLTIDGPARFYRTFLDTPDMPESDFLVCLIDQFVRGVLEEFLGSLFDPAAAPSPAEIQSRLTRLTPKDLADDLAPCGLSCVNLALYTAAPPVDDEFAPQAEQETDDHETAGHLNVVEHN